MIFSFLLSGSWFHICKMEIILWFRSSMAPKPPALVSGRVGGDWIRGAVLMSGIYCEFSTECAEGGQGLAGRGRSLGEGVSPPTGSFLHFLFAGCHDVTSPSCDTILCSACEFTQQGLRLLTQQ